MARAVPTAYFDKDVKGWVLGEVTPRSAAVALKMFPELSSTHPDLVAARDELVKDVRPFDNATPFGVQVGAARVREQLASEDKTFYPFQEIDLGYLTAVLKEHGGGYLGWERGLGKTLGTCALIDEMDCQRTLVVAPNTAKQSVWGAELARWCPWLTVLVLPNDKPKRIKTMAKVKELTKAGEPFVLVVHYEALAIIAGKRNTTSTRKSTQLAQGWDQYKTWDLVVSDEAHRLANPKAQMSRAIKKIPAAAKLALSGSIIQNHAEELFSVLQWLFPATYRSQWRDWNDRYLDYIEGGWSKICIGIKAERIDEMREELGVFMVYRRKEDELDLPDKTEQTLLVDLSPGQRKAYNELLTTCITTLDSGDKIKAADGLVMLTRLRQLASGLDLLAESIDDSSKLDLAVELVEDAQDEAFVVFNWYKASGRALRDRLEAKGIACFLCDGDTKQADRTDYIERFQAGEVRVFIGTLSTIGESVTLHRATNAIFIDRSWNPATNIQAADRIYRIGQNNAVTITHIIARDTVDELRVQPALANKEALRRAILGGT
jgi:SNF2 family DNA or RNA helicase